MTYYGDPAIPVVQPSSGCAGYSSSAPRTLFAAPGPRARRAGPPFRPHPGGCVSARSSRPASCEPRASPAARSKLMSFTGSADPYAPVLDPVCPRGEVDLSGIICPLVNQGKRSSLGQPIRRRMIPPRMTSAATARCAWNGSRSATDADDRLRTRPTSREARRRRRSGLGSSPRRRSHSRGRRRHRRQGRAANHCAKAATAARRLTPLLTGNTRKSSAASIRYSPLSRLDSALNRPLFMAFDSVLLLRPTARAASPSVNIACSFMGLQIVRFHRFIHGSTKPLHSVSSCCCLSTQ